MIKKIIVLLLIPVLSLSLMIGFYFQETKEFMLYSDLWFSPILSGLVCSLVVSYLGIHLIMNRMVFMGLAMTQISSLGVFIFFLISDLLGIYLLHTNYSLIGGLILAILFVLFFDRMSRHSYLTKDALVGVFFVLASSFIIIIANFISYGKHEIDHLLFGNSVTISSSNFIFVMIFFLIFLFFHLKFFKKLLYFSFDANFFKVQKKAKMLSLILLFSLSFGISVSLLAIGSLPTFAMMIIPPMMSLKISRGIFEVMLVNILLVIFSYPIGYYISYIFSLPTGASVVGYLLIYSLVTVLIYQFSWDEQDRDVA